MSSRSTCRCSCSAAVGIEFFSVCLLSARCSSLVARRSSLVAVCPPRPSLSHTRAARCHSLARQVATRRRTSRGRGRSAQRPLWTKIRTTSCQRADTGTFSARKTAFGGYQSGSRPTRRRSLSLRSFARYNPPARFQDLNTKEDLVGILGRILDNLKQLYQAPGANLEVHPPDAFIPHATDPANEEIVHNRLTQYAQSHFVQYLRCVESGLADPFGSDLL